MSQLPNIRPSLLLDFANTRSLDPRVTFTRASGGTHFNAQGLLVTAGDHRPRFDHDPVTGQSLGLLVEEARTNLLLNSETLSTQSVTVTAAAHTLSFYGTGSVELSGTHSATLTGTGAFPARVTLTFTPTAGTLTLTVTGTVQNAQLELGAFPTSYIATTGATATRAADVASITGSNFSGWYNQNNFTIYSEFRRDTTVNAVSGGGSNVPRVYAVGTAAANTLQARLFGSASLEITGPSLFISPVGWTAGSYSRHALAFAQNNCGISHNGNAAQTDSTVDTFTADMISFGRNNTGTGHIGQGWFKKFAVYPRRLSDTELQELTK